MSPLWLERRALGIFPGRTWLYTGRLLVSPPTGAVAGVELADMLLAQRPAPRWWPLHLDVTLSDEMARMVVLPWQDTLRTAAQQMRYAEACLEDVGVTVAAGWAMQYGYRRHGKAGMAYALPVAELERLKTLAAAHHLRLRSVLPVAAAAYWRYPLAQRRAALLLLAEAGRYTSLRFEHGALAAVDVQPARAERDLALRRLMRRSQMQASAIERIGIWSFDGGAVPGEPLAASYPDAVLQTLDHRSWE